MIATYRRGAVLLDTLRRVLALDPPPGETVVVDQTEAPAPEVAAELRRLDAQGRIRWIAQQPPAIPLAMNAGLLAAHGRIVLFFDDDVIPQPDVVAMHVRAYAEHPEAWAVAGRVIQPEPPGRAAPARRASFLEEDLHFNFGAESAAWVSNIIACHGSVIRRRALEVGGFDANFIPPVSFRFETEFAKRLIAAGGRIWFEPRASIRHLRAGSGGTRAHGNHLASASPLHGVGAYYYFLCQGRGWRRAWLIWKRPFREVRTRFHLRHPWFIPVKLLGECRALALAYRLHRQGPRLIKARP